MILGQGILCFLNMACNKSSSEGLVLSCLVLLSRQHLQYLKAVFIFWVSLVLSLRLCAQLHVDGGPTLK